MHTNTSSTKFSTLRHDCIAHEQTVGKCHDKDVFQSEIRTNHAVKIEIQCENNLPV